MPEFMRWGGPDSWTWAFGWWTGKDDDLLCVVPNLQTWLRCAQALSPVCSNRFLAVLCFLLKRLVLKWDENELICEEDE